MEIKSSISLEVEKNERIYRFEIPVGAPYGEAIDAAFECFTKIEEMARETFAKAKEEREKAVREASEEKGDNNGQENN